jgi:predicted DNA-binding transcriptional regulator YafY
MPSHGKGDVIQRQWEMLRLIPSHDMPGRTAVELTASLEMRGYQVARRTVERDLDSLLDCMPLEVNRSARPQRWRWQKTRGLEVPGMEAAEAMALYMMKDAMQAYLPSCFVEALNGRFVQADKTLATLARTGRSARWSDRVRIVPAHVVLKPPRISRKVIQELQRALLNDIAVEVQYQSLHESAPKSRVLYPRGLLLRGSSLYLIADQKDSGQPPYHYAVQRFSGVRLRALEPWPATPFSLDAFLADGTDQFGDGRAVRLVATISPQLHKILRDAPLGEDMRIVEKGEVTMLSATVRDTWALHSWLLGHAENICVQQPAALRHFLAAKLQSAARQYA